MADVAGMLDELQRRALKEADVKEKLLATREEKDPLSAFCKACRELGYEIYEDQGNRYLMIKKKG